MNDKIMQNTRERAQKLADNAVTTGILRTEQGTYTLDFNRETCNYDVTLNGEHVVSFRTYKITQAKNWLREYIG